ncbi:Bug family tripartite tricarboxylate transporter substrate binding protein [Hydrogenophaga sp.]|uniref:Bug family tripartite tricarboxylate transporter substrate binding protein n=1 Tax=Hydrogenophaga sp. TaxID=1904254 RepID=UPI003D0BD577
MKIDRRQLMAVALAAGAAFAGSAMADAYPEKTISLVVAYPPGGDSDATARLFADKLSQRLKQTVIVENKPGAGGTLGNTLVASARPDGYTLLFTPNPFTTAPMVLKLASSATYDPLKDFEPVILTAMQSVLLVTHPDTGIKTVADLVAQAKAGKPLTYASPGAGSPMHIAAEWLNRAAGIQVQHIPFRGVGPMIPDMLAGRVSMGYPTLGAVEQHLKSGKLVAVALTDDERSPLMPQLRTVAEQGYPEVKLGAWNGIFAPKGTPPAVIRLLNEHMNEILRMPDVVEKMASFGSRPVGGKPEALAKINADDFARLSTLVKDLNIQAD